MRDQTPAVAEYAVRPHRPPGFTRDPSRPPTWAQRHVNPSEGWWENGALVVRSDGSCAVVDAGGGRHPFPPGVTRIRLVTLITLSSGYGPAGPNLQYLLLTDDTGHVIADLPYLGWDPAELARFALRARLDYRTEETVDIRRDYPDLHGAARLRDLMYDRHQHDGSYRARLRRLFRR